MAARELEGQVALVTGATQLTVMLRLPTSCASDFVKPTSAAFAAA